MAAAMAESMVQITFMIFDHFAFLSDIHLIQ